MEPYKSIDKKELAKMTGQEGEERTVAYKLNEIRFNGDTGEFTFVDLLAGKGEDNKYQTKELGKLIKGVIIKMRWRLFKFEGDGETAKITSTSEFDNKNTDKIVVFGSNEKGLAADVKEKYGLGSQRVLYTYMPGLKQVVRIIVKASALSGEKNPNGELGLFDYVDGFNKSGEFLHEYNTEFSGVWREDAKNKRKSYFAMTFKTGTKVSDENIPTIEDMVKEVHEKTSSMPFADVYVPPQKEETTDYPVEDINPDDIPF